MLLKRLVTLWIMILSVITFSFFFSVNVHSAAKAQIVHFLMGGTLKTNGTPNAYGKVYFYTTSGKTTYSTVYDNPNKTGTALSMPIILDVKGEYEAYIDGQAYVEVYDKKDIIIDTYTGPTYKSNLELEFIVDVLNDYGNTADGDESTGIDKAIADVTSNYSYEFWFQGENQEYIFSADTTFPDNIKLVLFPGAYFTNSATLSFENNQIRLGKDCYIDNTDTITITGNITFENSSYITNTGTVSFNENTNINATQYQYILRGSGTYSLLAKLVSPHWFGFSSSNTGEDNQTYLTRSVSAMSSDMNLDFLRGDYTVEGNWTIDKQIGILGNNATLDFSTDENDQGLIITTSNVRIESLNLTGPQYTIVNATQVAVYAYGANVNNYISNIDILGCKFESWNRGIETDFVENFNFSRNKMNSIYHAGIKMHSSNWGVIDSNSIIDVRADSVVGTNAYGIIATKHGGTEAAKPVSKYISITNNLIKNVITWEALDTHGGTGILFNNNIIIDCRMGIMIGRVDTTGYKRGPRKCSAIGNLLYINHGAGQLVATTDASYGIIVEGERVETYTGYEHAEDNIIQGNTIDGYGDSDSGIGSGTGIAVSGAERTQIVNNIVTNSGSTAIGVAGSDQFNIEGNYVSTVIGSSTKGGIVIQQGNSVTCTGNISNNYIDPGVDTDAIYVVNDNLQSNFIDNICLVSGTGKRYGYHPSTNITSYGRIDPFDIVVEAWNPPVIVAYGVATTNVVIANMTGNLDARVIAQRYLQGLNLTYQVGTDGVDLYLYNNTSGNIDIVTTNFTVRAVKERTME
jgi:hypothetical protein